MHVALVKDHSLRKRAQLTHRFMNNTPPGQIGGTAAHTCGSAKTLKQQLTFMKA
jgi:hypothetical protein